MATKKGIFSVIELILLVLNVFNEAVGLSRIIHREVHRAGRSILSLLMLVVIFAILLTSTWFGLLALLFLYLISLHWGFIFALGILLGLNLLLIALVCLKIGGIKKNMLFSTPDGHEKKH